MTSFLGRRALAAVLCSAAASAALLVPVTAYADSVAVTDPAGDPVRLSDDGDDGLSPAPQAKAVDLVSTRFDYRSQVLVVRGTAVKASKSVYRVVRVKGGGRDEYLYGGLPGFPGVFGEESDCRGGSTAVNKETATYTVKIPARCFGAPERVRVGLGLVRSNEESDAATVDDAQRDGFTDTDEEIRLISALARG